MGHLFGGRFGAQKRGKKVNGGYIRLWRVDWEAAGNCGWFWEAWRGTGFRTGHSWSKKSARKIACAMLHGTAGEVYHVS